MRGLRALVGSALAIVAVLLMAPAVAHAQVSCAGVPAFATCTAYASGASVVFNNAKYTSIAPIPADRDCPPAHPFNPGNDNWWTNNGTCSAATATTPRATPTATVTPTPTPRPRATSTSTSTARATATTARATATATTRATATATAQATATATTRPRATATSTTAPTPTSTGTGNCAGVAAWTDCCGCTYTQNQKVTYNSSLYHAATTFTNTCGAGWTPGSVSSLWASDGACTTTTVTPTATATPRTTPTPTVRGVATPTATSGSCTAPTPTPAPPWTIGVAYKVGDIVNYQAKNYQCVVAHTAQAGWEPNGGGSTLWTPTTAGGPTPPPPAPVATGHDYRVGYFVQWGIYGRQYFVRNLDTSGAASKLTHVLYAFSNIDGNNGTCMNGVVQATGADPEGVDQGTGAGDASADYGRPMAASESVDGVADLAGSKLMGNFNQLRKLKAKYPKLHVMMSLGGWTYSKFFSKVAATAASRQKFVSSCIDMYIKGNLPVYNGAGGTGAAANIFDGFDIDWEYPGSVNGHPGNIVNCVQPPTTATDPFAGTCSDKANFVALMREFRTQLDALGGSCRHYELAAFGTGDGDSKLGLGWDVPGLMSSFDFVNVQGYDFHGVGSDNTWEPNRTGHQGNLYVDTTTPADPYTFHFSGDRAISSWINAGAPANKLTLGIPFYARIWKGVTDGGVHGEWQAAQGAACGQFGCDNINAGTRNTNNLSAISCSGANIFHDNQAVATFCYNGNEWATYDDALTISAKMTYVKSRNLLGAMVWEMSGDDGTLLNAINVNLP